ncbi:MAG TPA: prepilin peptidase [bacterium]|nr:prepilin peptidase [bacterium]
MPILLGLFFFISGASIASFLCNLSTRLSKNEQVSRGRSHCDHCGKNLSWYELIPIISYLFLRGRCHSCRKKIDVSYTLTECILGILFALSGLVWHQSIYATLPEPQAWLMLAFWLVNASLFTLISYHDYRHFLILDRFVAAGTILNLVLLALLYQIQMLTYIAAGGLNALFIGLIVLATKGKGMGEGDIKLAFLIGLVTGFPHNFTALFLGFVSGACIGVILIISKKKTSKDIIPFGPFLSFGAVTTLLFGEQILAWYLRSFIIF